MEVSCSRCSKAREPRVACREILFIGLRKATLLAGARDELRRCETAFDQRFSVSVRPSQNAKVPITGGGTPGTSK